MILALAYLDHYCSPSTAKEIHYIPSPIARRVAMCAECLRCGICPVEGYNWDKRVCIQVVAQFLAPLIGGIAVIVTKVMSVIHALFFPEYDRVRKLLEQHQKLVEQQNTQLERLNSVQQLNEVSTAAFHAVMERRLEVVKQAEQTSLQSQRLAERGQERAQEEVEQLRFVLEHLQQAPSLQRTVATLAQIQEQTDQEIEEQKRLEQELIALQQEAQEVEGSLERSRENLNSVSQEQLLSVVTAALSQNNPAPVSPNYQSIAQEV